MAGTMTNIENNTIRMYWNALRSMSKNIRLGLAVKLTNSVLEEERKGNVRRSLYRRNA